MGIAEAITRVKEGARRAGLEAVLRAGNIPAPLRPAAQRLADLLKADEPAAKPPVVSLHDAIAAHEAEATQAAHAGVSHDEMAKAGGVCPFTGMDASMAGLFEAPSLEVVHTSDALSAGAQTESPASEPEDAELVAEESKPIAREAHVAPAKAPAKKPSARVAASRAKPSASDKKLAAKPAAKAEGKVAPKPVTKPVAVAAAEPAKKKAQAKAEKVPEKLAGKASSGKSPARSTVVASARPAAKRPIAKAAKKKD